jgi:hypothetical protein
MEILLKWRQHLLREKILWWVWDTVQHRGGIVLERIGMGAKTSAFVVVDSECRVRLPQEICGLFDIREGAALLAVADLSSFEIVLFPVSPQNKRLFRVRADISDVPGALARLSSEIAAANVNIEAAFMPPGVRGTTSFAAVLDFSKSSLTHHQLEDALLKTNVVKKVEIAPIH